MMSKLFSVKVGPRETAADAMAAVDADIRYLLNVDPSKATARDMLRALMALDRCETFAAEEKETV